MAMRLICMFCFLSLLAVGALAQRGGASVGLSRVPLWPQDGVVPAGFRDWYVFLDFEERQLVLAYPENLGNPELDRNPGAKQLRRIDLGERVAVSVSVAVELQESGYRYRYRVSKGGAFPPLRRFEVGVPTVGNDSYEVSPAAYGTGVASTVLVNANASATGRPFAGILAWDLQGPEPASEPEESTTAGPAPMVIDFVVASPMRPGLTTAHAFGTTPPTLAADIPRVVRRQAAPMLRYNGEVVYTIGPTLPADAFEIEVVGDFYSGISRLVRDGLLDADSPAIREALRELEGYLRYVDAAYPADAPLRNLRGPPLVFRQSPGDGFEGEVLHAMKLSLSD